MRVNASRITRVGDLVFVIGDSAFQLRQRTRLVVERERARMAFNAAGYWDIEGTFSPEGALGAFDATLAAVDATRLASGRDFDETGAVRSNDLLVLDQAGATTLAGELGRRLLTAGEQLLGRLAAEGAARRREGGEP